eukprot:9213940-Pyramimonas_sp.AAC.1
MRQLLQAQFMPPEHWRANREADAPGKLRAQEAPPPSISRSFFNIGKRMSRPETDSASASGWLGKLI